MLMPVGENLESQLSLKQLWLKPQFLVLHTAQSLFVLLISHVGLCSSNVLIKCKQTSTV